MQNGVTAKVRYETAPKIGTLTYDSAVCLNHLHKYAYIQLWTLERQNVKFVNYKAGDKLKDHPQHGLCLKIRG